MEPAKTALSRPEAQTNLIAALEAHRAEATHGATANMRWADERLHQAYEDWQDAERAALPEASAKAEILEAAIHWCDLMRPDQPRIPDLQIRRDAAFSNLARLIDKGAAPGEDT